MCMFLASFQLNLKISCTILFNRSEGATIKMTKHRKLKFRAILRTGTLYISLNFRYVYLVPLLIKDEDEDASYHVKLRCVADGASGNSCIPLVTPSTLMLSSRGRVKLCQSHNALGSGPPAHLAGYLAPEYRLNKQSSDTEMEKVSCTG